MKKILLIHGWNYDNYTSSGNSDAWANRAHFVETLSKYFEVIRVNLPGFGGAKEMDYPWTLEDFVAHLQRIIEREKPEYALGYSFGGAVLLHWKALSNNKTVKAFLVSPAVIRRYERRGISLGWVKKLLPRWLVAFARDLYLTKVKPNPYYAKASPVMRETYRHIVGIDLRDDLLRVSDPLTLIYGENDSATPPTLIEAFLSQHKSLHKVFVLLGGGHDIANTHTEDLVSTIIQNS
jgi:pimeloyl-ACP methyl ester carboxylesterase